MRRYILTGKYEGELEFRFALNGNLIAFENRADLPEKSLAWLGSHFPVTVDILKKLLSDYPNLKAAEIEDEATFDMFWDAYAHKVDKQRAEKEWKKLTKLEQWLAIDAITAYDKYLSRHAGIEKRYPERFLKNRCWETEWSKM